MVSVVFHCQVYTALSTPGPVMVRLYGALIVAGPGADKMTFCFAPTTLLVMFHIGPTCIHTCQFLKLLGEPPIDASRKWLMRCLSLSHRTLASSIEAVGPSSPHLNIGLAVFWTLRVRAGFAAVTCDVTRPLRYEGLGAQVRVQRQLHRERLRVRLLA